MFGHTLVRFDPPGARERSEEAVVVGGVVAREIQDASQMMNLCTKLRLGPSSAILYQREYLPLPGYNKYPL